MTVTVLETLEDIFKAICDGRNVLCVDTSYPDATSVERMTVHDICAAYYESGAANIFIAVGA